MPITMAFNVNPNMMDICTPLYVDRIWGILLGLCRDNGKKMGNYYIRVGYILGLLVLCGLGV